MRGYDPVLAARTVAALRRELAVIGHQIRALLDTQAFPALGPCKGLGPVFQATSVALLPALGMLSRRQIARLACVAPMNRDSGQSCGPGRIRGGRAPVRVALYMATLSAGRWDPEMKARYQQLRAREELAKAELVACMRKLLTIIKARRHDELAQEAALAC